MDKESINFGRLEERGRIQVGEIIWSKGCTRMGIQVSLRSVVTHGGYVEEFKLS